jgi:16S rRNA C1402 (ribose-2'-O) methylase RsmI
MFKFIFILLVLFILLPRLFKWLLRIFVVKNISKVQEEFYRQQKNSQRPSQKQEGEIYVNVNDQKSKKKDFDGGEYIDYEEVK